MLHNIGTTRWQIRRVFRGIAVAALASFTATLAAVYAADVTSTWSTATSGTWNVNANWTNVPALGGFPNNGNGGVATYDAVINAIGSAYTVTLNTTDTVEHLTLNSANATLTITAGTFTANTGMDLTTGSLLLNGGTISNSTINAAAGTLNIAANNANLLTGVTINGDLTLNTGSARTKLAGGTTFTTAHLAASATSLGFAPGQTLSSTILFDSAVAGLRGVEMNGTAGTFTIGATGVIRTQTGLTGDGQIGAALQFGGAMTLTNQGLISSQTSGRTVTVNPASLANSGTGILEATGGGILTIGATNWSNVGNVRALTGSTATLNGAWSNLGGTITADATSTLNLGGSFATANLGTLSLASGSKVNVTGAWDNSGQTFTLNNATGSWTLNAGTLSGGTLAFADGKTLLFSANSANLLTGVTINGDLTLNTGSARTKLAGGTTFTTAHLAASATSLGFAPGQTLASTILFDGAFGGTRGVEMNGTAGTFTVGPTGVIRTQTGLTGDGQIGAALQFGGAMTLTNQGLISSQTSGRTVTVNPDSLANSGTGILEATGGGILVINPTNPWSNAGTISVNSATVNLNGTFNATGGIGTWSNTGGTVNVNGTINNAGNTLTLNNSTGSWNLTGGTLSGGTLGFADGKTLVITANSANLLTGVTVGGDLTLNTNSARTKLAGGTTFSTAHLAEGGTSLGFAPGQTLASTILFAGAAGGTRGVEMNGTAGTFTVGPTGVIRTAAGLGGNGQIGGSLQFGSAMTLTNQGLISSQTSSRTVTVNPDTLTNSGTGILEATGGGILTISATNWSNAGNLRALTGSTANLNGAWSNLGGTITADATSTLNFGGSFSTPNLGTLSLAAGSKVNVLGTWDNSGQSFTFSNATGSWTLNGGSISGGTLGFADGKTLLISASNANLLTGVTINGDLTLSILSARTKIAGGTTFTTAHLAGNSVSLAFAPGQTLASTILFDSAVAGLRGVEMNGTAGTFTVAPTGVIRTETGLTGDGQIGGSVQFGGAMTLANQGLISSQTSGRTVSIKSDTLTNSGTLEAINGGTLAVPLGYTQSAGTTRLNGGGAISAIDPVIANKLNTITIAGGQLEGSGTIMANVTNSATVAISPGLSAGQLAITGDLTLAPTSTLQIELGGVRQGTDFDFLSEAGTTPLNLAGTLNLTLLNGYLPAPADSLVIISSNQPLTGMFSNVVGGRILASDGVTSLRLSIIGNHVVLAGQPGDFNQNGVVDAADYVVWRNTLGQMGTDLAADGNGNNQVDAGDYAVWMAHFGETAVPGSGTVLTSVPEPASWLLGLAVVMSLFGVRPVFNRTPTLRETWAKEATNE